MNGKQKLFLALAIGCAAASCNRAAEQSSVAEPGQVPLFAVDPLWPKPLPNHWVVGSTIGVWVDDDDHIWLLHRAASLSANERGAEGPNPTGECCVTAPPVLEFDQEGNLLRSWGGPGDGYEWPESTHGIFVDHQGFVWLGGNGPGDSQILKFTKDGQFVKQYGRAHARENPRAAGDTVRTFTRNSNALDSFGRVSKVIVDDETNEVYISDGYFNRRLAVLNEDSGRVVRYWGAYGNAPEDNYDYPPRGASSTEPIAQQFQGPVHCVMISDDNIVYVCDRQNNRIQAFTKQGEFVKEGFFAPASLAEGSSFDIAFSKDPEQRFIYLADGRNQKIRIILRETLEEVANFGDGGRQPGQFYGVHSIATDSQGNLYTTETYEGKRLQRFNYLGLGAVEQHEQGVVWPTGQ